MTYKTYWELFNSLLNGESIELPAKQKTILNRHSSALIVALHKYKKQNINNVTPAKVKNSDDDDFYTNKIQLKPGVKLEAIISTKEKEKEKNKWNDNSIIINLIVDGRKEAIETAIAHNCTFFPINGNPERFNVPIYEYQSSVIEEFNLRV